MNIIQKIKRWWNYSDDESKRHRQQLREKESAEWTQYWRQRQELAEKKDRTEIEQIKLDLMDNRILEHYNRVLGNHNGFPHQY